MADPRAVDELLDTLSYIRSNISDVEEELSNVNSDDEVKTMQMKMRFAVTEIIEQETYWKNIYDEQKRKRRH